MEVILSWLPVCDWFWLGVCFSSSNDFDLIVNIDIFLSDPSFELNGNFIITYQTLWINMIFPWLSDVINIILNNLCCLIEILWLINSITWPINHVIRKIIVLHNHVFLGLVHGVVQIIHEEVYLQFVLYLFMITSVTIFTWSRYNKLFSKYVLVRCREF